ncbi:hypothetical protein [Shewanella cyperi]|uniref:hypothetical protein n=1 Tax=Shewanella cyperi TaxID=2814292 RepID=UPI001A94A399|nr:hypothetical protein [Shewanella cyperi]QSX40145.1 hypothetical protein JYB84_14370 [Shewanella cyperi]
MAVLILSTGLTMAAMVQAAADPQALLTEFDRQTGPLIEASRQQRRAWEDPGFRDGLTRLDGDALALLKEGWPGRFGREAKSQRALASQFLEHLQHLQQQMPSGSHCKTVTQAQTLETNIAELDEYLGRLEGYANLNSNEAAFAALMDMNLGQSKAVSLLELASSFRLCVIQDGAPHLVDGLSGTKGDSVARALVESLSGTSLPEPSQSENVDMLPLSQDEPAVIDDEPAEDDSSVVDESGDWQQAADISQSMAISDVRFVDPVMADCVSQMASLMGIKDTLELDMLSCKLKGQSVGSFADLASFPNLHTLSLSGGTIASLAGLGKSSVSFLTLEHSSITSFAGMEGQLDTLLLEQVQTGDWASLASVPAASISIAKPADCQALAVLKGNEKLVILSKDLPADELLKRQQQAQATGKPQLLWPCKG